MLGAIIYYLFIAKLENILIIIHVIIEIGDYMAVTKTKFINYIRCPNHCVLDEIKKEQLNADITIEEYKEEEKEAALTEILDTMFGDETEDLIDIKDEQLEIMLPYYRKIELLAGSLVAKKFGGNPKYSKETLNQESFDANIDGIRYLCYVDIYNERPNGVDIVEVKAITTNGFKFGKISNRSGEKQVYPIFLKNKDDIYRLREEIAGNVFDDIFTEENYLEHRQKLFDKYHAIGRYVYDLAVQRFIIEHDLRQNNQSDKIDNIKYYLAVLNSDYVFNGEYKEEEPVYDTDSNGNDIISFIDLTKVTKEYLERVSLDQKRIDEYLKNMSMEGGQVGKYCEFKKNTKCKYIPVCWRKVPTHNSIFAYIDNYLGFTDENGAKHDRYELINNDVVNMLDIPSTWLTRKKNDIQRKCVENNTTHVNAKKIAKGLEQLRYPIYHLDFETFHCPLPRYKGEKPYTQSVFQFSLHIERQPGVCDINKDHYEFLAPDHKDHREELINKLISCIDFDNGGSIVVYNEIFEKTRLKELGELFPRYKKSLDKMANMLFDLLYIVKTNTSFYKQLGFDDEEAKLFNYYHPDLNGSFSIKKVLPTLTNLKYDDLIVSDGSEAMVAYAKLDKLSTAEYNKQYKALLEYCKQDTWAMVLILQALRNLVKTRLKV